MSDNNGASNGGGIIAAERQRQIVDWVTQHGSAGVSELASMLGVADNTIRNDLRLLHKQGKLIRSHGGAVMCESPLPMPPYSQVRDQYISEKSKIATAALAYMPQAGSVFINSGSTTFQLVKQMQDQHGIEITTNSPEIAVYLSSFASTEVNIIGGRIVKESIESDGTLCEILDRLYWDIAFVGITAIDIEHGITSIGLPCAALERKVMENSRKVIGLCDSSKLGRFARAQAGPVSLIDALVTDSKAPDSILDSLRDSGIEIVIANGRE